MALAHRVTKSKATAYFVDENCLPQTVAVARTRAEPLGWKIIVGDPFADVAAGAAHRSEDHLLPRPYPQGKRAAINLGDLDARLIVT